MVMSGPLLIFHVVFRLAELAAIAAILWKVSRR